MMGMIVNPYALGPPQLSSISSFATATSTSATIAWPASLQAGDVAVLYDRAGDTFSEPVAVTPTGFTQIVSNAAFQVSHSVYYKLLTGSESGSITGANGNNTNAKMLQILRGDVPIQSVTVNDLETSGIVSGNPAAQVCGASAGSPPLVVYGSYGSAAGQTIDPRSFTPAKDGEITAAVNAYLAYKIYNASPADITIDMDDEGNNMALQSFYLTFT